MKLPIYQVDAFTDSLFKGNPAAVIVSDLELDAALMQAITAENNLSDTAFVRIADGEYSIRWFTPKTEVDLCGHATLASAHVLFNHLDYAGNKISFASKSGDLFVEKECELFLLDFPADAVKPVDYGELISKSLGQCPEELYRGRDDFLAVFKNEKTIAEFVPDMLLLSQLQSRGLIVTAPGDDYDFVSRFFAPQLGIPEDPVTGSAHTVLTPYWSTRLGKSELTAKQISLRGGELLCRNLGDRIEIGGKAVTYMIGEISV